MGARVIFYLSALREVLKQDDDEKKFSETRKKCLTKTRKFAKLNKFASERTSSGVTRNSENPEKSS